MYFTRFSIIEEAVRLNYEIDGNFWEVLPWPPPGTGPFDTNRWQLFAESLKRFQKETIYTRLGKGSIVKMPIRQQNVIMTTIFVKNYTIATNS